MLEERTSRNWFWNDLSSYYLNWETIFRLNVTKKPFRFVIIYRGEMYLREVLAGDVYDFFNDDGYRYTGK